MNKPVSVPFGNPDLQVFAETAITDPAELAAVAKRSPHPRRLPGWLKWTLGIAALTAAVVAGTLLGRFVL
jgi:hypothetical protein